MGSLEMGKTIRRWVLVYLGAVSFIIVPLYMRYGYFALIGAKARVYLYTAVPALIVLVVVEAGMNSGSLITAKCAADQGRT